jgi:ATP-dependent Clp protease ATP-binding subunit ClpC
MFERFTERARQVVVLARQEATMLNHHHIGPEHILLGLIREGSGVATTALVALGIDLQAVRQGVEERAGRGERPPGGHIPFTPQAKSILELSLREAIRLGHNYIGTEHILLGLISQDDDVAARILVEMGADVGSVRRQVILLLHGYTGEPSRKIATSPAGGRTRRIGERDAAGGAVEVERLRREVERLRREVGRLQGLLRERGVESGDGGEGGDGGDAG